MRFCGRGSLSATDLLHSMREGRECGVLPCKSCSSRVAILRWHCRPKQMPPNFRHVTASLDRDGASSPGSLKDEVDGLSNRLL
jgi:hypothetical protein